MVIFYMTARDARSWRALVVTALVTAGALSALAVVVYVSAQSRDAERVFAPVHAGVGAYSTWLILVIPLVPFLLAPPPGGFGNGTRIRLIVVGLVALLLSAAGLTGNRMFWLALAATIVLSATLAAWRWHVRVRRAPLRWLALLVGLLVVLGTSFSDTVDRRARSDAPPKTSVEQTLVDDPRLSLWPHVFRRIMQRPFAGYGFGKTILEAELRAELADPMLSHAHNLFVGQWLQTGTVGVITFLALLAALGWRYTRFLSAKDDRLALLGLVGLALISAFVIKNLTDDFLVRSTAKEFWALNAMLIGWGVRLERSMNASWASQGWCPIR
jgi:O-antigen ligase